MTMKLYPPRESGATRGFLNGYSNLFYQNTHFFIYP